ncbi:MAG: hypothetical protein JNJ54_02045 [Myxococcaceae bacterium]|nr:hypothetical protein [Myxococcaceae bacterium]
MLQEKDTPVTSHRETEQPAVCQEEESVDALACPGVLLSSAVRLKVDRAVEHREHAARVAVVPGICSAIAGDAGIVAAVSR